MTMSPGMQRKSVADATSVLDIVSAAGYVYYSGGELNYSGGVISGVASYTWAQFNDVLFDTTLARYVHITDRHSTTDGTSTPGSLWWVDPTATAIRKRNLVSGPIYYSTYAAAIADVPAATWPTMAIVCADVGSSRIILTSNASSYRPRLGYSCLFKGVYGTLASPTNNISAGTGGTSTTFPIGTPTIPAGLLAVGDSLRLMLRLQRHNANATMVVRANLGTAGDGNDADLWSATLAATNLLICPAFTDIAIGSATVFSTSSSQSLFGSGIASAAVDKTTNFNVASTLKFSVSIQTKDASDTLDLMSYSLEWLAA